MDFLIWLYSADATSLLIGGGYPPVLADPAVQRQFWTGGLPDAAVVGDWGNFRSYVDGFPALPPHEIMYNAIGQVVAGNVDVLHALGSAEAQMNAALHAQ